LITFPTKYIKSEYNFIYLLIIHFTKKKRQNIVDIKLSRMIKQNK